MTQTTNYGLKKPGDNDWADIAVLNENMDAIDLALEEKLDAHMVGAAGGAASLGADGKVPEGQLPEMNYDPAGSAAAVEDYAQAIAQGALELSPQAYVYGSADYYMMMFFTALTLPVIPLFVMAAVSFPIMKVISYLKQSSVLKAVIMIGVYGALFAALYVGMFYLQNSMGEMVFDGTEDAFAVLDKMLASLCGYTQHIYPSIWAARGMCGDWQSSLIYAAVILVLGAAALVGRGL